jgi:hypothetical protein
LSLKNPIAGCIFLMLVSATVSSHAVPPGFLEGHLKIVALKEVDLADDGNAAKTVTEEPYAEYPLVVLTRDGGKKITRVTADREGNYRVTLPPGDYVLDVQGRGRGHVRAKPQPFTVVSNQTVHVDMDIDTGIR